MNLNVYAVTRRDIDPRTKQMADRVVVQAGLTPGDAHEIAAEQRNLGYEGVKVECWA